MVNVPLRIVGVDGGGQAAQRQVMPGQVVTADNSQAEQRIQNATQIQNDVVSITNQSLEIKKAAAAQQADVASRGMSGTGLPNAIAAIASVAQTFAEMRQSRAERAAEMRDEEQERLAQTDYINAMSQLQDELHRARTIIDEETYERGVPIVMRRVNEVLSQYRYLDPERIEQVQRTIYSAVNNIADDMWANQQREQRDLLEAQAGVALQQARKGLGEVTTVLSTQGHLFSREERLEMVDRAVRFYTESDAYKALPIQQQYETLEEVYRRLNDSLEEGDEAAQVIEAQLYETQEARAQIQRVQQLYENGIYTREQANSQIELINRRFRTGLSPFTQMEAMQEAFEEQKFYDDLRQYQLQKEIENAPEMLSMYVGKEAAAVLTGERDVATLDPNTPMGAEVRRVIELYNDVYTNDLLPLLQGTGQRAREIDGILQQLQDAQAYEDALRRAGGDASKLENIPSEMREAYNNQNSLRRQYDQLILQQQQDTTRVQEIQRQLEPYGLHKGANQFRQFWDSEAWQQRRAQANQYVGEYRAEQTQNFNYGDVTEAAPARPLARLNADQTKHVEAGSIFVPFDAGQEYQYNITSGYHAHPGGRDRHAGIDIAPVGGDRRDHRVVAARSGRVVAVGVDPGGWGNYVIVEDQEGYRATYAHLASTAVETGTVVSQGTNLGLMGNTGGSHGPHLHFSVFPPGVELAERGGANTVDPVEYLRSTVAERSATPRGLGLPPQTPSGSPQVTSDPLKFDLATAGPPPGAEIIPGTNSYIVGNTVYFGSEEELRRATTRRATVTSQPRTDYLTRPADTVFTGANPYRGALASAGRGDYRAPNNPSDNYGYRVLAEDNAFRTKLHQVASRIGIPTQWLADIMAFETGGTFRPDIWNQGGAPAVGLIQFYSETGRKTVGGRTYTLQQIASMNRVQQLDLVWEYFRPAAGRFERIEQALMYVWGGPGRAFRDLRSQLGIGDGDITFADYLRSLGSHAGRRYYTVAEQYMPNGDVHTAYTAGCGFCEHARANGNRIVAHVAQ